MTESIRYTKRVEFICTNCGHNSSHMFGELEGKLSVPCKACGGSIDLTNPETVHRLQEFAKVLGLLWGVRESK